jgi:lipopolysaccharide transport system permease protein
MSIIGATDGDTPKERFGLGRLITANHSGRFIWSHRRLLARVTRGELGARYAGSLLGPVWAVVAPALILGVYAVVYMLIFRVRVTGLDSAGYVLYIFAGLVPYLACAEAVSTGVSSVITNKSVLNNTVFPIDLAPVKAVLLSQTTMATGLAITVGGVLLTGRAHWTVLLVPIVWLLLVMSVIGINWIISLLNVVFRDLQNLVTALLMVMLIVSPIAYTSSMVPDSLRGIILVNPFAYFVIAFQKLLVLGEAPSTVQWVVLVSMSLAFFAIGGWFFTRTKPVLVDYV